MFTKTGKILSDIVSRCKYLLTAAQGFVLDESKKTKMEKFRNKTNRYWKTRTKNDIILSITHILTTSMGGLFLWQHFYWL